MQISSSITTINDMKREYELKLNEMEVKFNSQIAVIQIEYQHLKRVCENQ